MNPTDEVDDLLKRAGARWRADQPSVPEPDLDQIAGGGRRPRRWVPALAAASVAAIAAAALTFLPDGSDRPAATPAGTTTEAPKSVAQGNPNAHDDLLVRNGDRVEVSGDIIAVPGKDPVFCAPRPQTLVGYLPGKEPAPSCPAEFSVTLKGVKLDQLTGSKVTKGVRSGSARVVGIWTDRTIQVQQQTAPVMPAVGPAPTVPCAPPAGGWKAVPNNLQSSAVTTFLNAHADQISGPVLHYPDGQGRNAPVVVTIGVASGDVAAVRTAFEQVYDGNLCVTQAQLSRSDEQRITTFFEGASKRADLGIYQSGGSGSDFGPSMVNLLVYTDAVKTALAPVGLDKVAINPAVKPVG